MRTRPASTQGAAMPNEAEKAGLSAMSYPPGGNPHPGSDLLLEDNASILLLEDNASSLTLES